MHNRLKYLRKDILKLSQKEFGEKIGLSISGLASIEKNINTFSGRYIKLICQTFNINEDWLRYGKEPIFIDNEKDIIQQLKNEYKLDTFQTELVKGFVNLNHFEKKAITDFLMKALEKTKKQPIYELKEYRQIKKFNTPVSAGVGAFMFDDIPYELIDIDLRTTPQARRADFALTVRGDSMEPNYYDGDIVFIKQQQTIENGQIGVFFYDSESYIKKYVIENNNVLLVSLNEKYKPIKIEENSTFKILGVVL